MRLSTNLYFQRSLQDIVNVRDQVQKTQEQISSGRKQASASDDPIAFNRAMNLEQKQSQTESFQRNIDFAENRLELIESTLDSVQTIMFRIRELTLQAGNGVLTNNERQSIAEEIEVRNEELVSLMNTKDYNGEYIFSGFSVDTEPFVADGIGYSYQGDSGRRELQIGSNTTVEITESGSIFTNIDVANNLAEVKALDGNTAVATVGSVAISDQAAFDAVFPEDYIIEFQDITDIVPNGPNYTITRRSDGVEVQSNTAYDPVAGIEFSGVTVIMTGTPLDGDRFLIESTAQRDLLSTVQDIVDRVASFATDELTERETFLAQSLENLENIEQALSVSRSGLGGRLNVLDSTRSALESAELSTGTLLSEIRDLDYAEAVSTLSFQTFVLEAAQQSYVRVASLSLFNFL